MKNYFTEDDERLKWKTNGSRLLLKTVVFNLMADENESTSGVKGEYIVMNAPDWVIVIPEKDEKFLMVKQWRHGEKGLSVEFPGGVIDKGEEPEAAAARELLEETGCKAGSLIKLGSVNPNPALFSNHVHVFLATNLVQTGEQHLDEDEFINYMEIPVDEVLEGMGTPQFCHALMGTALVMYLKNKRK
jgi:8-oxo-dGTP pyrophosphatase MutT (NUDIX family)